MSTTALASTRRVGPPRARLDSLTRDELLGVAIARGCDHYAPFVPPAHAIDRPEIPHEVLGCALFRGPADLDTFQAIRVGAMILSDSRCDAAAVASAARALGVAPRVAQLARLASNYDREQIAYWRALVPLLPAPDPSEANYLPTVSRFTVETGKTGPGRGPARIWLRTEYRP